MKGILQEIIRAKHQEVQDLADKVSLDKMKKLALKPEPALDFLSALIRYSDSTSRIIAECKQKSPSKGMMTEAYDPVQQALSYEKGGAAAVSVLTDKHWFGGSLQDLADVRASISLPILRKDFVVHEYQIYEARSVGADSFLLLAGVLGTHELQYFIEVGRELGMEPLVESHNREQLELALLTDAKILGINNRNLDTFNVDLAHAKELFAEAASGGRIAVCESGISGRASMAAMEQAGFGAFLIGEHLMRAENPQVELLRLQGL